ncbi:phenylalanine--tRNA ligase subunit beta [Synechococcus elongatus]|uniref:Phenylalanine--tRNA ligase beta subunit n=1 Tax=Synechococcus elongatus (strain ATCC 33912 / PCC 7942 / FACHB-805) TaxID=1140 RepID=SYFB_SYNE7|nr:phenylalanine--tRNA ligase subunit beta [Synechococcus elongatus]P74764.2 RecName: Full=Phenylalanine--tRNA ligase beta subunit; AltName: Full=Phenylalanyl-tRNA synthetase beta subunit; Short=PheRS [Synechococcus elongatus PCC 7942 = FACHB-805]ABB57323.1 phenylalanyl-tRNA synthetase beta subunit [Synechococcus elongatus PCC 7942 = FACHB-805]AJD58166.1 phenylalanyl-tRNA synthetase subunit beta [Synechococcus elongatus UTEX 2973]MBD2587730.1 phenylalanine--tRNA ligase subunit beta [Synechococc
MRISLNWLRELVQVDLEPEVLAEKLTLAGFEVEEIEDRRTWAAGVVVGRVLEREQHPNADRLSVCQVEIGQAEPVTIVCGASNVRADIWVAVATLGSYLPCIDLKLKPTKLRGVRSEGMICSLSELGLTKESEGIHIFPEDAGLQAGQPVGPLLGLDDVVLDLTSTANRADALSLIGIAREVRALTAATLTLPEVELQTYPELPCLAISLQSEACSHYSGTIIEGVTIAPSPEWLQKRLQLAGIRTINNVVDITNYILLEYGQPLHAFDRQKLQAIAGSSDLAIGVRSAQAGETLKTLDDQERTLAEAALVITAGDCPVALAGVMGGADSEVSQETTQLLLEAAWFEPIAVRRSARSQGLRTEASARYERGVNVTELPIATQRAIDLLLQIAGGTVISQTVATTTQTEPEHSITLRLQRINELLGPVQAEDEELKDLGADDIERLLTAIGCHLTLVDDAVWQVRVPPYRYRDLEREIDLIEEVARLYGYDNFGETLPPLGSDEGALSIDESLRRQIRAVCRGVGLTELQHYSLVKPGSDRQVHLANPLLAEYSALRLDLLSGLIDAFQYNWEQGNGPLWGFEIGRIFWREEDGFFEADRMGGILGGDPSRGRWQRGGKEQAIDWYAAKGVLEEIFERFGLTIEFQPDRQDDRFHPGRTASLWLQGDRLGRFGQLHPSLCEGRGLPAEVYAFELDLDVWLDHLDQPERQVPRFQPYSSFPASDRDLAFFVDQSVTVAELERIIRRQGGALLSEVELFDQYCGEHVPENQRSLAFRLTYRASDRTLTEAEVEPVHDQVRQSLVERFRVTLRS